MDPLITTVKIPAYSPSIRYRDAIMLMGSCFAEHIDRKLNRYKYNVLSNPFGILYNSTSMANSFHRILKQDYYSAKELVLHDGLYHSLDHHGSFSGTDADKVLKKINDTIDLARKHLEQTKFVFVSLGTSKVYKYKETGRIVANNHKIPADHFEPYSLSIEETIEDLEKIYKSIKKLSSDANIIWTVSPVRHIRGGLIENQRSKAVLILAIEKFIQKHIDTNYFPAYEIMMDQLRDYRYYARDLIHPSEQAIDIIWDVFGQTYLDPHESDHHQAIEKIRRAMEHRFLHDNTTAIKSFAESQLRNIDQLAALVPDMDWKEERQYFFRLVEPD